MKLYYCVSPIVLISLILPTMFFGDLTHPNEDCAPIQEEITTHLSYHSRLASSALMGQKYRFIDGGADNLYTNPDNWDTTGVYNGYPGTDVPSGDRIESIATILVPSGTTLNLACDLGIRILNNSGTIYFDPPMMAGPSDVAVLNNLSGGEIFINRGLNISLNIDNKGHFTIENAGDLDYFGNSVITNSNQIEVKVGGQISKSFKIYNSNGVILNSGTINGEIQDGRVENYGFIKLTTRGTILGTGSFGSVRIPQTIQPGGEGVLGAMTLGSLFLDASSVIDMEIAGGAASGAYDTIIIDNPFSLDIDGHIHIKRIGNFESIACEGYPLIQVPNSSLSGDFASVTVSNLGDDDWKTSIKDYSTYMFHLIPGETANNALDFHASDKNYVHINHDLGTIRTIEFKFFPNVVDPDSVGDNIINFNYDAFSFIWTMNTTGSLSGETLTILNTNSGNNRLWTNFKFKRQWYHVSIVSENGSTYNKIYIDGVDIEAQKQGNSAAVFNLNNFNIGGRDPGFGHVSGFFDGRMDEFRFWSVTRNKESIEDNWYRELDPWDMQGLMAYYKFDHGLAYQDNRCNPVLVDHSGNNYHGQLNDFNLMEGRSNWVRAQVCPSSIPVATNTFNGESSTSWSDPDNWSLGQVPSSCHHVVIPDGFNVLVDIPWAVCYTLQVDGSLDTQHFQFESFAPGE